ncbi:MAG: rhomboid family intramembrane serine protease [Bacteroidales bacterium]|nr:rhomboid family intramembrane serine protease [Bacteroidales bacterium]MCF8389143.1 rhomboid family intramembrane serine protease [Bacteroidales bacterium]
MGTTPPVVKNLLIINVLMFLGLYAFDSAFGIDLNRVLGLFYFKSPFFQPYQIVTHMFMHGSLGHLFFNMFALWMFGRVLEQVWGSKRFLIYYFVTGLGAAFLHMMVNFIVLAPAISQVTELFGIESFNETNIRQLLNTGNALAQKVGVGLWVPTVGASGAVFGLLLAFGMLFPNTQLMLLFPPIPIRAKYFVIGYGAIELYLGLTQPGSNVAHFAHLGGMLFGFLLLKYWKTNSSNFY